MHLRKWPSKTGKWKSEASITTPIGHRRVSPSRRTWSGPSRLSIPFGFLRTRQRKGVSSPCVSTWLAPFPIFQMAACRFHFSPSIGFEYSINERLAGTEASSCLVLT